MSAYQSDRITELKAALAALNTDFSEMEARRITELNAAERRVAELETALRLYVSTIHGVENRCMAVDGPVTPTHREITDAELRKVYVAATKALRVRP